jgi:hypothetical protein
MMKLRIIRPDEVSAAIPGDASRREQQDIVLIRVHCGSQCHET